MKCNKPLRVVSSQVIRVTVPIVGVEPTLYFRGHSGITEYIVFLDKSGSAIGFVNYIATHEPTVGRLLANNKIREIYLTAFIEEGQ